MIDNQAYRSLIVLSKSFGVNVEIEAQKVINKVVIET